MQKLTWWQFAFIGVIAIHLALLIIFSVILPHKSEKSLTIYSNAMMVFVEIDDIIPPVSDGDTGLIEPDQPDYHEPTMPEMIKPESMEGTLGEVEFVVDDSALNESAPSPSARDDASEPSEYDDNTSVDKSIQQKRPQVQIFDDGNGSYAFGDRIVINSRLINIDSGVTYQWQVRRDDGVWVNISGATYSNYAFIFSSANCSFAWRLVVTLVN